MRFSKQNSCEVEEPPPFVASEPFQNHLAPKSIRPVKKKKKKFYDVLAKEKR